MDLSKRVFGSNVDQKIIKYFEDLQKGSFSTAGPNESLTVPFNINVRPDHSGYLGDRTPFARMWTVVEKTAVTSERIERRGIKYTRDESSSERIIHIVNDNKISSYIPDEFDTIGELDDDQFLKPTAGITEINSESAGSLGALRKTTVKFIVHNKKDFDKIFLPFFLKPGSTVFVDFGWSDKNLELYDVESIVESMGNDFGGFYEKIYDRNKEGDIKRGLMSTFHGQVTKYDVKMTDQLSFDCTLEFVSSNYHLLDKKITDDNDLQFTFTNVLEDLLLLKYANSFNDGANFVKDQLTNFSSWAQIPRAERAETNRKFFDTNKDFNPDSDLIADYYRTSGIFYQDLSNKDNFLNQKEALYVSLAVFEDDFLNKFIAFQEVDGVVTTPDKSYSLPKFNSVNSYARWDPYLFKMMKAKPRKADKILSFLYPDTWNKGETSNKYKPRSIDSNENREWQNTDDDRGKRRIPIRELFIRTTTIIEAFESSDNINDALEKIFDEIFEDSGNLINIRLVKNNDAESSLGFYDINAQPIKLEEPENTLTFDITSGNSVVQNVDLSFETPKAGLSSMIAIGNQSVPELYDEFELMSFNLLNTLQSEQKTSATNQKYQIRHLPFIGDKPDISTNLSVDRSKLFAESGFLNKNLPPAQDVYIVGDARLGISKQAKDRYKQFKDKQKELLKEAEISENTNEDIKVSSEPEDNRTVFTANSERDLELIYAKITNFSGKKTHSVSPVMPINLTLEIYGNNFLNIGDYFTVNFLPEHYQNRVYFQIVGVNHSLSTSNWKTTYNTVMRPYTETKYEQFTYNPDGDLVNFFKIELAGEIVKSIVEDEFVASGLGGTGGVITGIGDASHLEDMVTKVEVVEETTLSPPSEVTGVPQIPVKVYDYVFDHVSKKDKINKKKKDLHLQIPMYYNGNSDFKSSALSWYITISEFLLSDEFIKWEELKNDKDIVTPYFRLFEDGNDLKGNKSKVIVLPTIKNDDEYNIFGGSIGERIDDYNTKLDYGYSKTEQAVVDYINNVGKNQKISPHITNEMGTSSYNPYTLGGFFFVTAIIWQLKDTPTKDIINRFNTYKFGGEGDEDVDSFQILHLPVSFLTKSIKVINNSLYKRYIEHFNNIESIIGGSEAVISPLSVGTPNPGYPFSRENYEKPGPWGSSSSVVEARGRLAQNFKDDNGQPFNSYGDYLAARNAQGDSFNRRKEDWDKSPNIW